MSNAVFPFDEDTVFPAEFIPMKRPGGTLDMGGLILYLASRAGAYINGNLAVIDGGRLGLACATY
jgi:NAD(P)-dependent dehydrogenase (short-subunit alcohol dehydrogenase family)